MRILHLANHCRKANGHVHVSVDMAITQAKHGHSVSFGCAGGDYVKLLEENGVRYFFIVEPHHKILNFFRAFAGLYQTVRLFRPDVVHVHMIAQSVLSQPFRLLGMKTVATIHNEFSRFIFLMGLATRIVTVSKRGAESMQRRGLKQSKIRVVINGPVGSPRLPASFEIAQLQHPAILTVCGMHHRKGVMDLLNAFKTVSKQHAGAYLYLVGDGPSRLDYEALAKELEISGRVIFLGHRDDPRPYFAAADIFVLASHADPGPLVIAEARHAGCAIVATAVDGIPEMLDGGLSGVLVPPKQPRLLAEALCRLLDHPEELARFAALAKHNSERFTIERACRDMDKVYAELVKDRAGKAICAT